ncbi:MAG: MarR family transcriptional regulator [Treponemataceae bacterium]|nr:MarR family transcriptional regulator [Treponemataceae bacterium]
MNSDSFTESNCALSMMMDLSNILFKIKTGPVLKKHNLTPSALPILLFLYRNPDKNTASEICASSPVKRGIVSTVIDSLCKRGLLRQERDENDRRIQRLYLNEDSKIIIKDIKTVLDDIAVKASARLTDNEKQVADICIEKMVEFFQEEIEKEKQNA